jgi:hypothetical protein
VTKVETTLCHDAFIEEKEMCIIDSEKLAYWYFRLNGFLTIENFVVHPNACTELDLIAARFPNRNELYPDKSMQDDECLKLSPDKIRIVLVESTIRDCKLNPALINSDNKNIERVLWAIGAFEPERKVCDVSKKIYNHGWFEDDDFVVSLCCLGKQRNPDLHKKFQEMLQLTWDEVLSFIHKRFRVYEEQKRKHPQWDETGTKLWNCAKEFKFKEFNKFRQAIKIVDKIQCHHTDL